MMKSARILMVAGMTAASCADDDGMGEGGEGGMTAAATTAVSTVASSVASSSANVTASTTGPSTASVGASSSSGGAPLACEERPHQFTVNHGDVYFAFDGTALDMKLRYKMQPDDVEDTLVEPDDTCIVVADPAGFTLPVDLAETYADTGIVPETTFWLIPEVQDSVPTVPWLGTATYELPRVDFGTYMTMRLLAADSTMPDGASLALFVDDVDGPLYLLHTAGMADLEFEGLITESHGHMSWTFTHPGEYRLVFQGEATRMDGTTFVSDPTTYLFRVGVP